MKPTTKTDHTLVETLLLGGYMPSFDLSLRLGRDIQNDWMNSYQDVQVTNTYKVVIKRKLMELPDTEKS